MNKGSAQIASKLQIALLERQRPQPRHTFEMSGLGGVLRSCNPEKNRWIDAMIDGQKQTLGRQKGLRKKFGEAAQIPTLSKTVNRAASRGISI